MRPLFPLVLLAAASAQASEVLDVSPITDRIVLLHLKDGHVEYHKRGQKRGDDKVFVTPLDVAVAGRAATYTVTSADDPAYRAPRRPTLVGRKTKGTEFAWFTDRWIGDRFENDRPDHVDEHWLYLRLPTAMKPGATYRIATGGLATNGKTWPLTFNPAKSHSETVHVNLMGYVPTATRKIAYLYYWAGDWGGIDLKTYAGSPFRLIDLATGKAALSGKVAFRRSATNAETGQANDTPNANFLGAEVWECDFSLLTKPGRYVVAVDGIGCSFPFALDADVYRKPFVTVARGLYHNRSGIALTKPYTTFERPAPHNPLLTPAFRGKLKYTTSRQIDWKAEDADPADKPAIEAGIKGDLDVSGWYQDAGDWDSYPTHLRVAQDLLLAYRLAPGNFTDGELNIPESGNGVPDILDEAAWLPRFAARLRAALKAKGWGKGGVGLRVAGDWFGDDTGPDGVGRGSWEDDRTWIVSGEDPVATYRYAGVAAELARVMPKDPQDWAREARESYAWAAANTRPGDEAKVKPQRLYAAAALFALTGEAPYEAQVARDTEGWSGETRVWSPDGFGAFVYALAKGPHDPATLARVRTAILATADYSLETADRRALRWGGDFSFPMLIGQQTTPQGTELAVAWRLTGESKYLAAMRTTADYFLGSNALNQTWVTGLGPRHPNLVFHMDAWYNGKSGPHPGIIPYGPWRKDRDVGQGPWDHDWPNKTVYPKIDLWPGGERYFDNRCSPLSGEFTIHQNTAPTAALFGILCAPKGPQPTARNGPKPLTQSRKRSESRRIGLRLRVR